jgi:fructose-1,6-bisphosphatase I
MSEADIHHKIINLSRHIYESQRQAKGATGQLSDLLMDLALACKHIQAKTRKAGLLEVLGATDQSNVHGETVKKLDMIADEIIFRSMDHGGHLCAMASEENEDLLTIPHHYDKGHYVMLFDPLDGSSNIDANVSVGTIFSIHRRVTPEGEDGTLEDCLQPGYKQVCAGYVIYGSSTVFVYTTGHGVHGFTYDPSVGEFLLSHPSIRIPETGSIYSANDGNWDYWDKSVQRYIRYITDAAPEDGRPYSSRYIGSLVADFHRNLLYGGVFLYPADSKSERNKFGKLRLLYEASPLAFIVEQAGGKATTGKERILDIIPTELHQRVPLVIGSTKEVELYEEFVSGKR